MAALTGAARLPVIRATYLPFLLYLWLAGLNEGLSLWLICKNGSNTINSNIYVLCEYLLLLLQFRVWTEVDARKYAFLAWLGSSVWIGDNLVFHQLHDINSLFRSFASVILILLSVQKISTVIKHERRPLLFNPDFQICLGFLLFYSCKAIVEVIYIVNLSFQPSFYRITWLGLSAVNCISNIIFASAVLCIPKKPNFTWPW